MKRLDTGWYKGTIERVEAGRSTMTTRPYLRAVVSVEERTLHYYLTGHRVQAFLHEFRFRPNIVTTTEFLRRCKRLWKKEVSIYVTLLEERGELRNSVISIRRIKNEQKKRDNACVSV